MPTAATTVADLAAERLAKRQAGTEARYWELVRAAAREEGEFNPDEACDFLEQTGRDPHEFQDHVALVRRRIELDRHVRIDWPRIRARQEAIDAELKQRTDEFLAAQRAHQEAVEPLRQESITLGSLHKPNAQSELIKGCPYRWLVERYEQAGRAVVAAQARRDDRQRLVREHEAFLRSNVERPDAHDKMKREVAEGQIDLRRQQLAEAEEELARLRAEQEDIERQMLTP